jgi:uncharacterized protein (TIGR02117 family)
LSRLFRRKHVPDPIGDGYRFADKNMRRSESLWRWPRRLGVGALVIVAVLAAVTLVTARRGDPRLYPAAAGAPSVEVWIVSNGYHTGVVLPRARLAEVASRDGRTAVSAVAERFGAYKALEFGWGEEGFYTSVPTIASLTVPLALRALFRPGNATVVHIVGLHDPAVTFANSDLVRLQLSEEGFARLLARLDATFALGQGGAVEEIGRGLYGPSLFYRAVGSFHLFRVCNHWVAELLDAAGVPTAPVLATVPPGLLMDLRWRAGAAAFPH